MIRIKVEVLGPIANKPSPNPATLELEDGATVGTAMEALGYGAQEMGHLLYLRGQQRLRLAEPLVDGETIQALLHVGGG